MWGSGKGLGFTQDGTHAEFLRLPRSALSATPSNLDFAAAASCGVPFLTALEAIERSGVTAGTKVLVLGAAGAVGYAAIQLAKVQGAQVLAAVRKSEQAQQLQTEGFATLLLGDEKPLPEAVQAHFGAEADVIFEGNLPLNSVLFLGMPRTLIVRQLEHRTFARSRKSLALQGEVAEGKTWMPRPSRLLRSKCGKQANPKVSAT